jgi:hypothetical protein
MSVSYPVAKTAQEALEAPLGRAVREREARTLAGVGSGVDVVFAREDVGPAFETREAALEAYGEKLGEAEAPENRYLTLREVLAPVKGRAARVEPAEPVYKGGRRWPKPKAPLATRWRLSISYWRIAEAEKGLGPARKARRDPSARALGPEALAELTRQPLTPVEPQQPLDIGLFEVRAPEDPGLVLPDE